MSFQGGDRVIVTTVNNGTGPSAHKSRKHKIEKWYGRVIQPSVIAEGWWLVRRDGLGARNRRLLNTVPEREMTLAKRKP